MKATQKNKQKRAFAQIKDYDMIISNESEPPNKRQKLSPHTFATECNISYNDDNLNSIYANMNASISNKIAFDTNNTTRKELSDSSNDINITNGTFDNNIQHNHNKSRSSLSDFDEDDGMISLYLNQKAPITLSKTPWTMQHINTSGNIVDFNIKLLKPRTQMSSSNKKKKKGLRMQKMYVWKSIKNILIILKVHITSNLFQSIELNHI